ncbi:MAG: hypothetical protein ACI9KE_000631 [Polyangiales bacterium]|jgi:hypothetical protein
MTYSLLVLRRCAAASLALLLVPSVAGAVCRVIEPSTGENTVAFDPTTTVLVVQAPEQVVEWVCPPPPRTLVPWGEEDNDDADDSLIPLPPAEEEGKAEDDEPVDPSVCWDGSAAEPIYDTLTHVVVQPSVYARGGRAGLVMPIHRRADVHAGPADVMALVNGLQDAWVEETLEFQEDATLGHQCSDPHYASAEGASGFMLPSPLMLYGCGDSGSDFYRPGLEGGETSVVEYSNGESVEFERIPVSDDYTATVLSASSEDALFQWMDDNDFAHDAVDDAAFAKYVGEGQWFVALEVHPEDLGGEQQALAPLVVTYRGDAFPITHELSFDPEGGIIETDLFVLAPQRMAVEAGDSLITYAGEFNLDVFEDADLNRFGLSEGWLTRIHMERRMSDILQLDTRLVSEEGPAATEEVIPTLERTTRVRIAQACCPGNAIPDGDAPGRIYNDSRRYRLSDGAPDNSGLFYSAPAMDDEYCYGGASYDEVGYGGSDSYGCTVAGATASYSPLFLALFIVWRKRRRRVADSTTNNQGA